MNDQTYSSARLLFPHLLFTFSLDPVFSHSPMGRQQITWQLQPAGKQSSTG